MKCLPATAFAILILSSSCGNGQSRIETPTPIGHNDTTTGELTAFQGDMGPIDGGTSGDDPWADELERPAGVQPIDPASFVTFLGFSHGDKKDKLVSLFPESDPRLGKRADMDMAGSEGYKFEGHFAAAWDLETSRIEFLSVRSEDAIHYLAAQGHRDSNLQVVWGMSPGAAHGLLGEPSQVVNRPHAVTYRYDFHTSDERRGTASLEFSKLAEPVRCSAVSVHWYY